MTERVGEPAAFLRLSCLTLFFPNRQVPEGVGNKPLVLMLARQGQHKTNSRLHRGICCADLQYVGYSPAMLLSPSAAGRLLSLDLRFSSEESPWISRRDGSCPHWTLKNGFASL